MTIRGEGTLRGLTPIFLREIIRETLTRSFPSVFSAERTVTLDVACVSDVEIAKLNSDYRQKDKPTDILSFGALDNPKAAHAVPVGAIDLGQIVLSPAFIARSAEEDGVSWKREFTYVFSHGILHLVGFDHEERMFQIQDDVTDFLAPVVTQKK